MVLPKLGIDVSKGWFDACLLCGKQLRKKQFSNDEKGFRALSKWLVAQGVNQAHMCMEATGRYGYKLATHMHDAGHKVSVVNPRWIADHRHAMGKRNKTDAQDALVVADYARCREPEEWTPKNKRQQELADIAGEMALLKKAITAFKNRGQCGLNSAYVEKVNSDLIADLERHLVALEEKAQELISADHQTVTNFKILMSVPGIGEVTAFALVAKVDMSLFPNGRHLAVYVGVSSKEWQSGKTRRPGKQSKEGSAQLRGILRMGAMSAMYKHPLYITFAERLRKKGLEERQITNAVARKILLIAHALIRKQQLFDSCYISPLAEAA